MPNRTLSSVANTERQHGSAASTSNAPTLPSANSNYNSNGLRPENSPVDTSRPHTNGSETEASSIGNIPLSERFIAVRKKKILTYHVGNIDPEVTDDYLYSYMVYYGARPTSMKMFYGAKGSSARVNVHEDCKHKIEADNFWPKGITFRAWKSHEDFLKDREEDRQNRRDRYMERRNRANYNRYDTNNDNNRYRNRYDNDDYDTYSGNNAEGYDGYQYNSNGQSTWGYNDIE